MLFVTMFCYLFFYTGRHNFGWAARGIAKELDISFQQVGWISFTMLMGYAIGQLINGNLADRWSPKMMIVAGGGLSILCNLAISFAGSYTAILVLWTLNGYFQSMAWGSGGKLISNWWSSSERGKAFGFYTMAAGSSSVLTFLMALVLVQQEQSWRTLFRYPILFLAGALLVFLFVAYSDPKKKAILLLTKKKESRIRKTHQNKLQHQKNKKLEAVLSACISASQLYDRFARHRFSKYGTVWFNLLGTDPLFRQQLQRIFRQYVVNLTHPHWDGPWCCFFRIHFRPRL